MSAKEPQIERVKTNAEKQLVYREQLGRYNKALKQGFYFEALLIVYALLEDRLRSFLYYIGAVRRAEDTKLNVAKTKRVLRELYFGIEIDLNNKRIDLQQISTKEDIIRRTVTWALEQIGTPENQYLSVLKSEYERCLDPDGLLQTLDGIDKWREYRNEIIHGLLNKKTDKVNADLYERVQEGMAYARFLDSQVKALKKENAIRETMRIKR